MRPKLRALHEAPAWCLHSLAYLHTQTCCLPSIDCSLVGPDGGLLLSWRCHCKALQAGTMSCQRLQPCGHSLMLPHSKEKR